MPVASMPRMRGNVTPGEWPCRVNISERLSPNAWIRISTSPAWGTGMGRCSRVRLEGPPGVCRIAARMVFGGVGDMVELEIGRFLRWGWNDEEEGKEGICRWGYDSDGNDVMSLCRCNRNGMVRICVQFNRG